MLSVFAGELAVRGPLAVTGHTGGLVITWVITNYFYLPPTHQPPARSLVLGRVFKEELWDRFSSMLQCSVLYHLIMVAIMMRIMVRIMAATPIWSVRECVRLTRRRKEAVWWQSHVDCLAGSCRLDQLSVWSRWQDSLARLAAISWSDIHHLSVCQDKSLPTWETWVLPCPLESSFNWSWLVTNCPVSLHQTDKFVKWVINNGWQPLLTPPALGTETLPLPTDRKSLASLPWLVAAI